MKGERRKYIKTLQSQKKEGRRKEGIGSTREINNDDRKKCKRAVGGRPC